MGINISVRDEDWGQNYRCPDVVVFLPDNLTGMRNSHSVSGPDFAVEIVTEQDRSWDKLDFYAEVNTRELLIVDRNPWRLTLLRLDGGALQEVGSSQSADNRELVSEVIPFSFRLVTRAYGPAIEIKNLTDGQISYAPEDPPLPTA